MWRLHVLAAFFVSYGLLEVGDAMRDGSYYRESWLVDYPDHRDSTAPFTGGGD